MSKPSGWPAWLLFVLIVAGPPSAVVAFLPTVTSNPFVAGGLLLAYEVLVGLGMGITAVIKKIWERRGDTWADASAGHLEIMLRLLFAGAGRRYWAFFRYEHADLDMKGISARGTYALDLEQVFIELRIDPTPAHKVSSDPIHLPSELGNGTHDIWDYLTLLDQHVVILGAPGSGKTTLLKHLGLRLIQDRHQRKARASRLSWIVPLFLPLREHSSLLKEQPNASLIDIANIQIRKWKQAIPPEWIERQLQKGRCLILLDGLDEIADATQRQQVVDWVQDQMLAYGTNGKNRFVITSRPLGYRTNPLDRVAVLEVQPFTFEQVTQFLRAWYLANEIKRAVRDDPGVQMKAHEGAEDLLKRLHTTPALFVLAVNPLLLTMIATVHLYYGTLPGARTTLYKAICEVFLSRRVEVANSPEDLRAEQRQVVLQTLAYTLMRQGKREISRQEACQLLKAPLQLVGTTQTPERFLDHLEAISSGLLLEREQGVYSFAHQTFQEYLAMAHMQKKHLEHELLAHVEESWWHEAIRLFCAQADATAILEACLTQSLHSLEALTLAIDCAEEALTTQAEVKERLYTLLEQGVNDTDPERRRVIAEALLKRRLRQMRPLQGAIFVDTSLITCAEYQLFLDEQRIHGYNAAPDTWSEQTFPQGQGRDPLLGARVEDAEAFCRWLTERDWEGLSYRLPRREERQQIKAFIGAGLPRDTSYWEEDGTIVWSQTSPSLSLQEQVHTARDRAPNLARDLDRATALDRARDLARDLARVRDIDSATANARANARDLAGGLARDLATILDRALDRARDLARDLARDRARAGGLELASDFAHYLSRYLAHAVEIYVIIFLFLQRPKGILPVYEGILLIKERATETLPAPRN